PANISARTLSGASDVPDTTSLTRSGLQSASVTWRITCGTTTSPGMSAPWRASIAVVTATRDWKLPPAEYQTLYVGSARSTQSQNSVCSSVRRATVRFFTGIPSSSYAWRAVYSPSEYSYAHPLLSGLVAG